MKKHLFTLITLSFIFLNPHALRAESSAIDFLRSTGKIYSVIAVLVVILIGITIFLYRLDKKLTKLENQINNEH